MQTPSRLRSGPIIVALVVLFVAIRLVHLTADPPTKLPNNHAEASELVVEGPAKAQEARNKALFGEWKTNPVDNYQFWRIQSPAWVYPLWWSFRAFGVGYAQLRLFSILTAVLGLIGVLLIAARRFTGWPLVTAGLLVAANYYYVFYCRAGLLEPLLSGFLAFTVLFLLLALKGPSWLIAAQLAFVCAFLTKQTALTLVPLLLVVTVWAAVRARRAGRPAWHWAVPLGTLAAVTLGLGFYVVHDEYWRTVVWNFGHVLFDDSKVSGVQVSRVSVGDILARLFDWNRWRDGFFLLMPVGAPLILLELSRVALRAVRRREISDWDVLVSLWFLLVLGSLQVTPLTSLRYHVVLILPGALLAAGGLQTLLEWAKSVEWPYARTAIGMSVVLAVVMTHGHWFTDWARDPTYTLVETNRDIAAQIGENDAVIVGAWAPPLVLETPYQNYYVKEQFNTSREAIESLGITHLLVRRKGDSDDSFSRHDWSYWTFKKMVPQAAADAKTIQSYELWDGYRVDLRALGLLVEDVGDDSEL